jgi:hypothetical protein
MKTIKQTLMSGAIMLALSLAFTSCDELIGELDNLAPSPVAPSKQAGTISFAETSFLKGSLDPAFTNPLTMTGDGTVSYESSNTAVATVDATGKVTIQGPGTTTIKAKTSDTDATTYATNEAAYTLEVLEGCSFMKWDDTKKQLVSEIETNCEEVSTATTTWNGSKVLVVKDADVSITTNLTLSGNTTIILCDGAKLTTKQIHGSGSYYSLTIYGQSAQTGQLIAHPDGGGAITMIQELNIHGGDIEAIGGPSSEGVNLYGGTSTLNVYGGKLTARGSSNNGIGCKALNILGGTVEAYGGTDSNGFGFLGIFMNSGSEIITVSNDGRLKAVGGDGTSGDGGQGISGTLVAKDNAVVEAYGGHATSGNQWGGYGISNGNVEIHDNARITCVAGNSKGTADGNPAIPNNVYYHGGTLIAIGGAKGDSDHNDGNGISGTLTNSSGGTIYYATNSDGSDETFPTIVTMLSSDPAKDFTSSVYRGIKVYK